jgi:uncharacterized protein (UPF0264 family)
MKYFTISELTASATAKRLGINNFATQTVRDALTALVDKVLDPVREMWGAPIVVNSGYRCPALNKAVGGAAISQHVVGEAADIEAVSKSKEDNKRLFEIIRTSSLPFDQLINEYDYSWVHVSHCRNRTNRRQVLAIG